MMRTWFVTPYMAESTSTMREPELMCDVTTLAAPMKPAAEPTLDPPNLSTRSGASVWTELATRCAAARNMAAAAGPSRLRDLR